MNISLKWVFSYLALFTLFLSLGVWQINRANEKQDFLNTEAKRTNETVELDSRAQYEPSALRYKNTTIVGHYDTKQQFLLDNQIDAGKAGYFVFTPFILQNSNKAILVNRGWIPLVEPRATLPNVNFLAENDITINGRINNFPSIGLKLAGANQPTKSNPAVVGVIEAQILATVLGVELFHFQLELDANSPNGFKREWTVKKIMQPEQHLGYAFQWFGLAFVLTIIFIKFGFSKTTE
ncbi:SURF1-like protein [Methylococcaceae bacterium]|nr:SURF1-like protein [Methylococcaceae bacterium]